MTWTLLINTLSLDIAAVRKGIVGRIARPGRWVVWMPEGATKPRMRFF